MDEKKNAASDGIKNDRKTKSGIPSGSPQKSAPPSAQKEDRHNMTISITRKSNMTRRGAHDKCTLVGSSGDAWIDGWVDKIHV